MNPLKNLIPLAFLVVSTGLCSPSFSAANGGVEMTDRGELPYSIAIVLGMYKFQGSWESGHINLGDQHCAAYVFNGYKHLDNSDMKDERNKVHVVVTDCKGGDFTLIKETTTQNPYSTGHDTKKEIFNYNNNKITFRLETYKVTDGGTVSGKKQEGPIPLDQKENDHMLTVRENLEKAIKQAPQLTR